MEAAFQFVERHQGVFLALWTPVGIGMVLLVMFAGMSWLERKDSK